jgi:CMP-N,N'-diacetyllegionaminic acid synthase
MKILAVIPARSGSKGVPNKNIKLLGGKPLLAYSIETANQAGFEDVMVSTNDNEIADLAKRYGAQVPFLRPQELASDSTPTIDVIVDLLIKLGTDGITYDAVCLLQPTSPFRDLDFVISAINKFRDGAFDSLISVQMVPSHFNPHWVFFEKGNCLKIATGENKIITRRQDLPQAYIRDGSLYFTKTNIIIEQKSLYGQRIGFIQNNSDKHVNIDTLSDWEKAELLV